MPFTVMNAVTNEDEIVLTYDEDKDSMVEVAIRLLLGAHSFPSKTNPESHMTVVLLQKIEFKGQSKHSDCPQYGWVNEPPQGSQESRPNVLLVVPGGH